MKKTLRNILIGMSVCCTTWLVTFAQQATTPKAQPSLGLQEKATNPMPSSSAQGKTQKNSVGKLDR